MTIVAVIFATKPDAKVQYDKAITTHSTWESQIDSIVKKIVATPSIGVRGVSMGVVNSRLLATIVRQLVVLSQNTVDIFVKDFTETDLVSFISSLPSDLQDKEISAHVHTDEDNSFLDADQAITRCIVASTPLREKLGMVEYSGPVEELTIFFSIEQIGRIQRSIEDFNHEVERVNNILKGFNTIVTGDQVDNATQIAQAMVSALNTISVALNGVINTHNVFFRSDTDRQLSNTIYAKW